MKKVILMNQQGVPYETSPARYQLVHELKRKGYETYVFNLGRILHDENWKDIDHYTNTLNMSSKTIRKKMLEIMPEYVIATTNEDIKIIFPLLLMMKRTSFIYYNLEIYTPQREQRRHRNRQNILYPLQWRLGYIYNKAQEILFTKKCKLFTIQDTLRKRISKKYFICHPDTLLIPNSYIYSPKDWISSDCLGIVYSGILTRFRTEPLMGKLQSMSNFPIVFSGKSDEWSRKQFKALRSTHPDIELREQSLPLQKHLDFLKQYAVGFVWYDHSEDENEEYIGMASGKLFRHLSIGQPVIVSSTPGLAEMVNRYRVGIVINDISELAKAYEKIMSNYAEYQDNIKRIYKKRFDYANNIKIMLAKMEEM